MKSHSIDNIDMCVCVREEYHSIVQVFVQYGKSYAHLSRAYSGSWTDRHLQELKQVYFSRIVCIANFFTCEKDDL